MELEAEKQNPNYKTLKILCVLSYLFIGIMLLTSVTNLINGPLSEEELNKSFEQLGSLTSIFGKSDEAELILEKTYEKQILLNENVYSINILNTFIYIIGIIGIRLMWQRKKLGFHFYIIYSILSISAIYLIVPIGVVLPQEIIQNALLSLVWVFLYARQLKHFN